MSYGGSSTPAADTAIGTTGIGGPEGFSWIESGIDGVADAGVDTDATGVLARTGAETLLGDATAAGMVELPARERVPGGRPVLTGVDRVVSASGAGVAVVEIGVVVCWCTAGTDVTMAAADRPDTDAAPKLSTPTTSRLVPTTITTIHGR